MPHDATRRDLLRYVGTGAVGSTVLAGGASGVVSSGGGSGSPALAPTFADGFAISPLAPVEFPTAIRFGPGDAGFGDAGAGDDRPDLYAAILDGEVLRYHLAWTDVGPTVRDRTVAVDGLNQPLGITFLRRGPGNDTRGDQGQGQGQGEGPKDDALLVSDSHQNDATGRTDGTVLAVESDGERRALVDGLPNGRHNTNHLGFGPDDRLYLTNGNTTDDGCAGGDPEVLPYSGAILAVDLEDVEDEPAILEWTDEDGDRIEPAAIPDHPVNEDFAETVDIVAHGFRNPYGLAFDHDGVLHTGMNGADDPASPDVFFRLDEPEGTDYRYPYCFDVGPVGATGEDVRLEPNPAAPDHDCHVFADVDDTDDLDCGSAHPTADGVMGWHVCATGLDFPADGPFAFPERLRADAFVGECGTFSPGSSAAATAESGDGRNTGHSVAHVPIDDGDVAGIRDFVTGLSLPTDVVFGPQGAMYVADLEALYRVQPIVSGG